MVHELRSMGHAITRRRDRALMFSALWLKGRRVSVVRIQLQKNTEFRTLMRNKSPALGAFGETIFVVSNLHLDCASLLPLSSPQPAVDNRGKLEQPSDPLVWQQAARTKKRQQAVAVQGER
jgi:hypothetical protein